MTPRKRFFAATLFLMSISLTGCFQLIGDLDISTDGKVTGKLRYGLSKELGAALGITDFKAWYAAQAAKAGSTKDAPCEKPAFSDDSVYFYVDCTFASDELNGADDDLKIRVEDKKVVVTYKSGEPPQEGSDATQYGIVRVDLKFPGPVTEFSQNRPGLLEKISDRHFRLSSTATEYVNVRLAATCDVACGQTIQQAAAAFQVAPKNFGGMMKENIRFIRANSPYKITKTIQIPAGKIVYVEPGVTFLSSFGKKTNLEGSTFWVQGKIFLDGTRQSPITLNGKPFAHFNIGGAPRGAEIRLSHVNATGGGSLIEQDGNSDTGFVNVKIYDSIFTGMTQPSILGELIGRNEIARNRFVNTGGFALRVYNTGGDSLVIRHNAFEGTPNYFQGEPRCWLGFLHSYNTTLIVESNSFAKAKNYALCASAAEVTVKAQSNYWGTLSATDIDKKVLDAQDSLKYKSLIDVSLPLVSMPAEISQLRTK